MWTRVEVGWHVDSTTLYMARHRGVPLDAEINAEWIRDLWLEPQRLVSRHRALEVLVAVPWEVEEDEEDEEEDVEAWLRRSFEASGDDYDAYKRKHHRAGHGGRPLQLV